MNTDIAQHTFGAVLFRKTPEPFVFLVPAAPMVADKPALPVACFHVADFAKLSCLHNLFGGVQGSHVAIGQVHHVDELVLFSGCGHFVSQCKVFRQRLFAEYMLFGIQELHRRRVMDGIGRHIGGSIKSTPGNRFVEIGEMFFDAKLFRKFFGTSRHHVNRPDKLATWVLRKSRRMRLGHAASAQNEQPNLGR